MNKMFLDLEKRGVHILTYADDVGDFIRFKFQNAIANLMKAILNHINRWAVSCGLYLNASKTELVLFTRNHRIPEVMLPLIISYFVMFS